MQLTLVSLHVEEEHQRSKHFPTFADRRLKKTHNSADMSRQSNALPGNRYLTKFSMSTFFQ